MIDLHSHILPGIDDGPGTLDESLEMAQAYERGGFTEVVATPHWISGTGWMPAAMEVMKKVSALNQALIARQSGVRVHAGMEIAFDPDIARMLAQETVLPLAGGSYVLIESPFQRFPMGWAQVFSAVLSKGYKILLAHPERCEQVIAEPLFVQALLEAGVYLQVNCDAFLGNYGTFVQKTAVFLASKGYVHCVATDSHDPVSRSPANFFDALRYIEKLVGPENCRALAFENPGRVLSGDAFIMPALARPETLRINRWKFW